MRTVLLCLLGLSLYLTGWSQTVDWSVRYDSVAIFSSPRAADLNQDGVDDIVLGAGIEMQNNGTGIVALDGQSGQQLWQLPSRDQIFSSAVFEDLNGDGHPEVIFAGRDAQLLAIQGDSGKILWEFWPDSLGPGRPFGWLQFYTPLVIPDQNGDLISELIVTTGGSPGALSYDSLRPPGALALIDGHSGQLLQRLTLPDDKETYCSPLLHVQGNDSNIVFGSGGETVGGHFYSISLRDVVNGDSTGFRTLLADGSKGFIVPPAFADLDGDGDAEIFVAGIDGRLDILNGNDFSLRHALRFPGYEHYVSPLIGQFTGDQVPDMFGIIAKGQWAFYGEHVKFLLDGATGQIVWTDTTALYQLTQPNALDWDGDGRDEVLLIHNYDAGFTTVQFRNVFQLLDFDANQINSFGAIRPGINFFSTPLIADLDRDSVLEVIYTFPPTTERWNNLTGARIERMNLGRFDPDMAWSGYLGNHQDGYYRDGPALHTTISLNEEWQIYPNPATDRVRVPGAIHLEIWDIQGRKVDEADGEILEWQGLSTGMYGLIIVTDERTIRKKLMVQGL